MSIDIKEMEPIKNVKFLKEIFWKNKLKMKILRIFSF